MMNFGLNNIRGGFAGTKMLVGFYLHGPNGQLLDSGLFDDLSGIDPPENVLPSAPTNILITVADPLILPSQPTNILITTEDT